MNKGIITAIHEGRAVALKQDGTFIEVKNKNYNIGQTIRLPETSLKKYAALAAGLALLFIGGISGYTLTHTATSYVYVDINPSLRLDINPFDAVITVVPLNEDAKDLLNHAQVYNKDIRTCVENIITASEEARYLNETNTDVEISVLSVDEEVIEVVTALMEQNTNTLEISATAVTAEECEEAMDVGISAGRLEAVKAYTEYFGGSVEENILLLEDLSIRKIYLEISTAEREKERSAREEARQEEAAQREAEREAARKEREEQRKAEQEAERQERQEQREEERAAEREARQAERESGKEEKEEAEKE